MYAQNSKISFRQYKRLLTLELFGVTTLLLPGILCKAVNQDGITALAGGLLLVWIYGYLLRGVSRCAGKGLQRKLKQSRSMFYDIFLFVMFIQLILMGIWVLSLVSDLSRDILLQDMDLWIIIILFAAVCMISAVNGMESRGRMAEVVYPFLLIPFVVVLFLAAKDVNPDSFPPILCNPTGTIVNSCYEVFIVFQGVTLGLFALPFLKNKKVFWKGVKKSTILNGVFCLLLMGIAIGVFGVKSSAGQKWLAINLMTTPTFPIHIVERLDVLMVTIWIVALFFFVSGVFLYGGRITGRLFHMKGSNSGIVTMTILVTLGSVLIENKDYAYYVYLNYMKYIGVPLLLGVLLCVWLKLKPVKVMASFFSLSLVLTLTGCQEAVELQNRDFVLALGMDYDGEKLRFYYDTSNLSKDSGSGSGQTVVRIDMEKFSDLEYAYGQQSDKYLDYNHLKAIIIDKKLALDAEKMSEMMEYIETDELFPRNVKLFYTEEGLDKIFEIGKNGDKVVGEYLEKIYIDSNYYIEEQSTSLGNLINHWYDREELLVVPVIHVNDAVPLIQQYAVVKNMAWAETLEPWESDLFFLGNGVDIPMEVELEDGHTVQILKSGRNVEFYEDSPVSAVVSLDLKAVVVNEKDTSEKTKRQIEKSLDQKLNESFALMESNRKGQDLFYMYKALQSRDRNLWLKYRDDRKEFNKKLGVVFEVDSHVL